ncbi:MAG: hypothetical protein U0136_08135 [Bdellovibrionota bacterium]
MAQVFPQPTELERDICRRHDIPLPVAPAAERLRSLFAFRSGHYLWPTRCERTGKRILSATPPSKGYKIYDVDAWLADDWDAKDFGRPYDFTRPFFEQFSDLLSVVPISNVSGGHASLENSGYCNFVSAAKNCYLIFSGSSIEDCLYGRFLYRSRNLIDCFYARDCELCYSCRDIEQSYGLSFSSGCSACSESTFLENCRSCRNCYCCSNLVRKEFYWMNEPLSPSEWHARRNAVDLGNRDVLNREKARAREFFISQPTRAIYGTHSEGSTGNYLHQTKDCFESYLISESELIDHCVWMNNAKSCAFVVGFGNGSELLYNSVGVGNSAFQVFFSAQCRGSVRDLEYCFLTEAGSHDCFGCVSVRRSQFCILNKQYSESEYRELLSRVKAHMRSTGEYGRFFPNRLAPSPYNQSDAAFAFPLDRESAEGLGFGWGDEPSTNAASSAVAPNHIALADHTVLDQVFQCTATKRGYKFQRKELEFLQSARIALPSESPFERIRQSASFLLWKPTALISCAGCGENCTSVFDPKLRPILCEGCYQGLLVDGA